MTVTTRRTLSSRTLDALTDVADEVGASLNATYPGRGMYGHTCVALVTRNAGVLARFAVKIVLALRTASVDEDDELTDDLTTVLDALDHGRTREDQLGLDRVYYWPELVVEEEP